MKPTINIHNYEEFFLLYVDGELSADDRLAVELFVEEYPHLRPELEMLQQTVLEPDTLAFDDKAMLFREAGQGITVENCETYFLLYVDNELDAAAREEVEKFVLRHPSLQDAFMQLKQTRLPVETISFPNKASLYRKETKERRVVYINWQRMAVAAVIAGLALFIWTVIPSEEPATQNRLAFVGNPSKAVTPETGKVQPAAVEQPGEKSATAAEQPQLLVAAGKPEANRVKTALVVTDNEVAKLQDIPAEKVAVNIVQPPVINLESQTTIASADIGQAPEVRTAIAPQIQQGANNTPMQNNVTLARNEHADDETATMIQPAVYRELNTEEEDDKKSLYLGSLEINKDKLRGIFRKASSLFRGKAREADEKTEYTSSPSRSLR